MKLLGNDCTDAGDHPKQKTMYTKSLFLFGDYYCFLRKEIPFKNWGLALILSCMKPIWLQILLFFASKYLLFCKKGTLSPFNDHLHRREETGGWGHLRSAVSVISVGNGADAGFIGVLFSSVPRSRVSVHTDNSIYSDVPWHNRGTKCIEQQNPNLPYSGEFVLVAFVTR